MTAKQRPANVDGGQTVQKGGVLSRAVSADFILSAVLLCVFAAAFVGATNWSFDAKIFPMIVSGVGMVLTLLKMALALRPPSAAAGSAAHTVSGVELTDEDDEADEALEYVFETASRTDWLRVLGWAGGFFLAFFLVGAIPSILVFTVLYLFFEARATWLVLVVYALVLSGILYGVQEFLNVLLPDGILFG
ncbi:tripartite tricarboxylate transporter TctB family protein [Modestobacter sp. VKM Ac-2979]|uniref:tripartite tricarboxylate transporter TctB family protein n=1 Tax=unclassified Modestobacter TaxID=2643866 RepID=UPI0022ABB269|nr:MULTISPECIES: tripartite tricarboxylate transporter TctB family protein [unclassified Modestobacter]MCZ2813950.1 tripartite tricarboxylate transporter TctB family protein [Modestobacter sp. VKM Ac-2979]MCZ2844635.1 tripartite tricarboxylate transporter TctB family protein [Modestobacter sp. VKM Ac-2980]